MNNVDRITRLISAYRALRQFDDSMDKKYDRERSCNRRQQLSLAELEQLKTIEQERSAAALSCTEEEYGNIVATYIADVLNEGK